MNIRQRQENLEQNILSKFAAKSANAKREFPMDQCEIRTEFQRDRDRIIHCKSFRRLKFKTQVFITPEGDHYRTRLTHTLEVSQIARTIARGLCLNEDLCEAISLGHDLGHTPFGHIGENALNEKLAKGFNHNEQSLRVVEKIEKDGKGLNLTQQVRDGIVNHKKDGNPKTLEGKILSYADRIAYLNHDIDDAIRAEILKQSDLPKNSIDILGKTHGLRINNMISDIITLSADQNFVKMSDEFENAMAQLREFMFERVYLEKTAKAQEKKAHHVIHSLFDYYYQNPEQMGFEFFSRIDKQGIENCVKDYIACMTDRFAINTFKGLFVPKGWGY